MSDLRPIVLLTRPVSGSERFAQSLGERFGKTIEVQISPLQQVVWLESEREELSSSGVIFTSQNGVLGWNRHTNGSSGIAYCVGPQTAALAAERGFRAVNCGGDADALVEYIKNNSETGPLIHYRGDHGSGNIAIRLTQAGIETIERIVYRQVARKPTPDFYAALQSGRKVIASLFSPRSASLFFAALPTNAAPWLAVISANAAERVDVKLQHKMMVARAPNGEAMLDSIEALIGKLNAS